MNLSKIQREKLIGNLTKKMDKIKGMDRENIDMNKIKAGFEW